MMDEIQFQKVIDVVKAYEDDGELYIEGESSGPEIDLDKQFMTPECVADMAKQVNETSVPFGYYEEHNKRGILSELGDVVEASVTPEYHMRTKVRLDKDNAAATLLWKKVRRGKQYGMSIAGRVIEPVKKLVGGVLFQGFNKLRLDHIANTTKPSWAPSLGTLVAKSLEQDGFNWADAPEYEGDLNLPFSAHVKKRSEPDPKAGKGYLLVEELLRKLNSVFGWEKYQDKVDEENRDAIPLQDIPALQPLFPVGTMSPPAKGYDEEAEEWQGFIQKAVDAVAVEGGMTGILTLGEIYERLYWMANALTDRDKAAGKKDGKKTVTRLKAAMSAVEKAMKQMLSKSQPEEQPEPLTYGEPPPEEAAPPGAEAAQEEQDMPDDNTLKSFDDVAKVAPAVRQPKPPEPSVGGGALTDFSQVAEAAEEKIAARAELPQPVVKTLRSFEDVMTNLWSADADVTDKQGVLLQIGKRFVEELRHQLEGERPEEERIARAVSEAVAPLVAKIEGLEVQLAVVKSQKPQVVATGGEPAQDEEEVLVRRSIPGGRKILQPSRYVQKQREAPTFYDEDMPWFQPQ